MLEGELWEEWESLQNPHFQLDRAKSCLGKRILIYQFKQPLQQEMLTSLNSGQLSFPLGSQYAYFQFEVPGQFVITGLLGELELRVVPRLKASLIEVSQLLETHFEAFYNQQQP